MKNSRFLLLSSLSILWAISPVFSYAQVMPPVPAPATADRIQPIRPLNVPATRQQGALITSEAEKGLNIPADAKNIRVLLKSINVEGVTVFSEQQIRDVYKQYIGKRITLDTIWIIAERITRLYRDNGYFLSRAYVPAQEVDTGVFTLRVVEGYVGRIEKQNNDGRVGYNDRIANDLQNEILRQKPLNARKLEEFILRMNDLPGRQYRTILKPLANAPEGAVELVLVSEKQKASGTVTADNFSSRFLGPYTGAVSYRDSFIPGQETGIVLGASMPADELKYVALDHVIPLTAKGALELSGTHVSAEPGYTLEPFQVESMSTNLRLGYRYKMLRQWNQNLTLGAGFTHNNVDGDIMNTTLTHDRIRAAELKLNYDNVDRWNGYNAVGVQVRRGLEVLGSSKENDLNLSRGQAKPDFTTLGIDVARQQALGAGFVGMARAAGQLASDPLYSAEEFGFGGQSFGRAYDPSEIIGDQGLSGAVELAYAQIKPLSIGNTRLATTPFIFYDIGKVWNKDLGAKPESGSSAGIGVRLNHSSGLSGQVGLAQPLSRAIDTPLNGGNGKNPRLLLQISYGF